MSEKENEELFSKARNSVFRLLRFRLRSENEIYAKLKAKKLPVSIIKQTIKYFKDLDLIDDRQFAYAWTSSRLKKPFGINRIRLELKKHGIDPVISEATITAATDGYDELDVVTRLAQYRASKYRNIDPEKIEQRVYGYLLRRGFNTNIIIKAIKTL
jgi:regulatory protein